jgi:hypothetical protein
MGATAFVDDALDSVGRAAARRFNGGESDIFSHSLTIRVRCFILESHSIFTAWRRAQRVYLAPDVRLAGNPTQSDAASVAQLCSFHANHKRIDGTYQFIRYDAA